MKRLVPLLLVSLFIISCGSKSSPSSPSGSGGGFSGTVIQSTIGESLGTVSPSLVQISYTSSPVTNAAITLVTPSGNVALSYLTSETLVYQGQTMNCAAYEASTYTYTPGSAYTMNVSFGGNKYSMSVTAIGGSSETSGSTGVTISWTGGGTENTATVEGLNGSTLYEQVYGPSISSTYTMPLSDFPGDTSGGKGNYTIFFTGINLYDSATSSLVLEFTATDQEEWTY